MKDEIRLMEQMLYTQITPCTTCGAHRERSSFDELPDDQTKEYEADLEEIHYFVHCPDRDTYSSTSEGGSSFEDRAPGKKLITISPSLNAHCPCGSGKKYKRCCGK